MAHPAPTERPATMTQIRGNKEKATETHIGDVVTPEITTRRDKKISHDHPDQKNDSQVKVMISTDTYTPLRLPRQDCSSREPLTKSFAMQERNTPQSDHTSELPSLP
jgi:hypothetical protein